MKIPDDTDRILFSMALYLCDGNAECRCTSNVLLRLLSFATIGELTPTDQHFVQPDLSVGMQNAMTDLDIYDDKYFAAALAEEDEMKRRGVKPSDIFFRKLMKKRHRRPTRSRINS